jgi:hypothetical protein
MVGPTKEQIYQAFCNRYLDGHKTLVGVDDEFEWWLDPGLRCATITTGRGGSRCVKVCVYCKDRRARELDRKSANIAGSDNQQERK